MADEKQLELLKNDVSRWNEWRKENPHIEIDLSGADLSGADLSRANLIWADLSGAELGGAALDMAILDGAYLSGANLIEANLMRAGLTGANLSESDLSGAVLCGARLAGANLTMANLDSANLLGATLDEDTKLNGADTDRCAISRYQLEVLTNYGGLTIGKRMSMNIKDDVATLRASYSGFRQWIHLIALASFVFPYAWFVVVQWSKATFSPPATEAYIPLWEALLTFIYNGGINWQIGPSFHWSFIAFLFLIFYNVLRAMLLWKTKQLELQQESSGLPAMFFLDGSRWGILLKIAAWLLYVYLAMAIFNMGHFFTQEIPIGHAEQAVP